MYYDYISKQKIEIVDEGDDDEDDSDVMATDMEHMHNLLEYKVSSSLRYSNDHTSFFVFFLFLFYSQLVLVNKCNGEQIILCRNTTTTNPPNFKSQFLI